MNRAFHRRCCILNNRSKCILYPVSLDIRLDYIYNLFIFFGRETMKVIFSKSDQYSSPDKIKRTEFIRSNDLPHAKLLLSPIISPIILRLVLKHLKKRGASARHSYHIERQIMRESPNIIVTGTPGVGKTVHCEQLAQDIGLRHLSVNQVAKDRGCFDNYDQELETWVVDEDKVRTHLFLTLWGREEEHSECHSIFDSSSSFFFFFFADFIY